MISERNQAPGSPAQEPLIDLVADLTESAEFGHRRLLVDDASVTVMDASGAVLLQVPIADIRAARNEPLVSGGRLELTLHSGEEIHAAHYSLTLAHLFSEAARGIEQLATSKPFSINLKVEKTRCEKCGRLLPEKDGVCPSCVNRARTLFRIARYLKPYRKQAIALAALSALSTALSLIPPFIQKNVVDHVVGDAKNLLTALQFVWLWVLVLASVAGLQIINGRLMTFIGTHISADLRSSVYRAIEFLQINFFDKKPVGAIASRVMQDSERVWGFLVDGLPFLVTNALMIIGVAIFMFTTNWFLTLCILAPLPVLAVISVTIWKPISNLFHRVSQRYARIHMHLNESLSGIRVVKAFAREDHEYTKFTQRNDELRKAALRADQQWNTAFGIMTFFTTSGSLVLYGVGSMLVYREELTIGQLVMLQSLLWMVYGPMQWFAQINNWFSRAMAGAERIFEIIDMRPEVPAAQGIFHPIDGSVEFDGIRFGYDKSNPVLRNLSFTAASGEMIGLVGHSGAGKSTTINLICRFYEPDAGVLRIDGIDYRDMNLHDYRRQIGAVLQEPFLFHGTIRDNIAYGKPDAGLTEVMEAAKAANAHNFILSKPDGYDTMVGERGAKLSGGERQRISIARAILHNPRILILDEATSSVDVETEKEIQEAIQHLVSGRTTFAIAHRLSTLRNANRLIVLERGEIAEIGTHEELMAKRGAFYKLVMAQSKVNEIIGYAG